MRAYSVLFHIKENTLPLEDASLPQGRFFKQPKAWEAFSSNTSSLIPSEVHTHRLAHHIIQPPPPGGIRWTAFISARFIIFSPVDTGEAPVHPVPPATLEDALQSWAKMATETPDDSCGTAHLSQPLSPRLWWSHPLTRMAPLPPSTRSSTDTNLAHSSQAGEYGAVDIDFVRGGKSRSRRLTWDQTGRKRMRRCTEGNRDRLKWKDCENAGCIHLAWERQ